MANVAFSGLRDADRAAPPAARSGSLFLERVGRRFAEAGRYPQRTVGRAAAARRACAARLSRQGRGSCFWMSRSRTTRCRRAHGASRSGARRTHVAEGATAPLGTHDQREGLRDCRRREACCARATRTMGCAVKPYHSPGDSALRRGFRRQRAPSLRERCVGLGRAHQPRARRHRGPAHVSRTSAGHAHRTRCFGPTMSSADDVSEMRAEVVGAPVPRRAARYGRFDCRQARTALLIRKAGATTTTRSASASASASTTQHSRRRLFRMRLAGGRRHRLATARRRPRSHLQCGDRAPWPQG